MKKTSDELEALFQALADRTRLRLLNLMHSGEVCVCFFVDVLDEPQPKISRHLAYLRSAGLVTSRRDAKWMHYSITPPESDASRAVFDNVLATLAEDPEMQRDRAALQKACCSPRVPDVLIRAPKPLISSAMPLRH
jgi:ArsR family transcriptional regulator